MDYEQALLGFLNKSVELGNAIQHDLKQAKNIFEQIRKDTSFASIIERKQAERDTFFNDCKAFARVIRDWSTKYPEMFMAFQQVLNIVIEEMRQIEGISIKTSTDGTEGRITIAFNEKDFVFNFKQSHPGIVANVEISEEDKIQLANEENEIVQEISEILTLDLHIQKFLKYIFDLNNEYKISELCNEIENASSISELLPSSMPKIIGWWKEVSNVLENMKTATSSAVKMDKNVSKQLQKIFTEEERKKIRDKRLKAAKAGLIILAKISLNLVPGGGVVQTFVDAYEIAKLTKDAFQTLRQE